MRPNVSMAVLVIRSQSPRLVTSACTNDALLPLDHNVAVTASPALELKSAIKIDAPSEAKRSAIVSPMPCPPPVIMATLPLSRPVLCVAPFVAPFAVIVLLCFACMNVGSIQFPSLMSLVHE